MSCKSVGILVPLKSVSSQIFKMKKKTKKLIERSFFYAENSKCQKQDLCIGQIYEYGHLHKQKSSSAEIKVEKISA